MGIVESGASRSRLTLDVEKQRHFPQPTAAGVSSASMDVGGRRCTDSLLVSHPCEWQGRMYFATRVRPHGTAVLVVVSRTLDASRHRARISSGDSSLLCAEPLR